jgi:hypothetical protein
MVSAPDIGDTRRDFSSVAYTTVPKYTEPQWGNFPLLVAGMLFASLAGELLAWESEGSLGLSVCQMCCIPSRVA